MSGSTTKGPTPRRLRVVGALCAAGITTAAAPSDADIYKWVDKNGVVHFRNKPSGKKYKLYKKTKKAKKSKKAHGKLPPFMPADKSPARFTRYDAYIREAAALYQIPEALVRAVIKVESDYDPRAVSRANARGLMQMIPETAERMMVTDIFDPRQNIFGGVRYLRVLANTFNGNLELTIAAYNAGENAVIRHGGIPPYEETQAYVVKVLAYYRYYRSVNALFRR